DRDEPLLAWWQYGAGRSLAWTSDVSGAWTGGFLAWEQAAAFFAGMISHILPAEEGEGEFSITRQGDTAKLRYAVDAEEEGLTTEALVLMPDGSQARAALYATAPGVYEGVIDASREGAYAVRVEQRRGDTLLRTLESGLTVGYAEEFDIRGRDGKSLLMEIARETGGRMLTDASEMFTERGSQTRGRHEITPALLTVCLLLFVLDVAQRRLAWERWLPAKKQEKRKEENPPRTAAKRGRPGGQENGKPEQVPAATMEKLLEGRKKKLM
ncbi:MAG: hypothetical protein FWF69_00925, partial [Firmicutes bacterium]|nr:hypothetical protein [Bacillota bacterium]